MPSPGGRSDQTRTPRSPPAPCAPQGDGCSLKGPRCLSRQHLGKWAEGKERTARGREQRQQTGGCSSPPARSPPRAFTRTTGWHVPPKWSRQALGPGAVAMVKAAPSQKTPLPTAAAQGLPTTAQHSVGSRWRFCAFSRTLPGPGLPRHTPPRRRHGRLRLEARATKSTPVLTDRYPTTALNSGPHGTATGRLGSRKCVRPPWDPALQPRTQGPCVVPLRHPADAPAALLRKPQAEAGGWALLCGLDSDGSPSSADEGYQGLLPLLRAISAGPRAQAT